jgi:hypothetical protein
MYEPLVVLQKSSFKRGKTDPTMIMNIMNYAIKKLKEEELPIVER